MRNVAVAVLSVLVGGCSMFMHSIEEPKATVRSASFSSAGMTGLSGQLALDVTNPNDFGVPLQGIDWQLSVGGARAITGRVQLSQTIPARGVAPVVTSLTVDARDAIAAAGALASGARDYQLAATLHFAAGFGRVDVAVDYRGTLL